jgi:hypothetical protein
MKYRATFLANAGDDFSTDVKISQPDLEHYACARLYNENQRNHPTYY